MHRFEEYQPLATFSEDAEIRSPSPEDPPRKGQYLGGLLFSTYLHNAAHLCT